MEYTELKARNDDRKWRIRYDMEALEWFEEKTGVAVFRIDMSSLGTRDLNWLVAAGLIHENKDVDLTDGREVINAVGLARLFPILGARLKYDLGAEDIEDEEIEAVKTGTAPKNVNGTGGKRKRAPQKSA